MSDFAAYLPDRHGTRAATPATRPAQSADLPGVLALAATRGPVPDGYGERLAGRLADPAWHLRVVPGEGDGEVLGWGAVGPWTRHPDAPAGRYVSALTVDPRARRRRLGLALLTDLVAGEDVVHSVVNARNRASLDLHGRCGFVEVARGATFAGITFDGGEGVLLRRTVPTRRTGRDEQRTRTSGADRDEGPAGAGGEDQA